MFHCQMPTYQIEKMDDKSSEQKIINRGINKDGKEPTIYIYICHIQIGAYRTREGAEKSFESKRYTPQKNG